MKTSTNKKNLLLPKKAYYTLKDVFSLNNHQFNGVRITMTVRHTKEIEEGKTVEIGVIPGGKGRPQKVYSATPVSQNTLNKAKADGIILIENAQKLVNVISVSSSPTQTVPVTSPSPVVST